MVDAPWDRVVYTTFQGVEADVQRRVVEVVHTELQRVYDECRPNGDTRWIDRVEGAAIDGIKYDGIAFFEFDYLREVLVEACNWVIWHSPVGGGAASPLDTHPGNYRRSSSVYVDGSHYRDIPEDGVTADMFEDLPAGATITIVNTAQSTTGPGTYARRIAHGWSEQAEPDEALGPASAVFGVTVAELNRKYNNQADIQFVFVAVGTVSLMNGKQANRAEVRFPAIQIAPYR